VVCDFRDLAWRPSSSKNMRPVTLRSASLNVTSAEWSSTACDEPRRIGGVLLFGGH
jgi:hypothetical protein